MYIYKHFLKLTELQKNEVKNLALSYLSSTHPNEIIDIGNGMSFSAKNLFFEVKDNTKYGNIFLDSYFDQNLFLGEIENNNHSVGTFIIATLMYFYFWYECSHKKIQTCI